MTSRAAKRLTKLGRTMINRVGTVNERPYIVFGNQKSGTSAIAHLLADIGGLSKTIDIPPLWPPTGVEIMRGERAFDEVVRQNPRLFSRQLIKEPMMTFFAANVIERFPESTCLFVMRDPRDNIRSLLNRRGIAGNLERLMPEDIARGRIAIDASVWGGEPGNYIDVLAHRWSTAARAYLDLRDRVRLLRYEEFVADKAGSIARSAAQLGIATTADITAGLDVQYQPRGNREIGWVEFFGSRNLEQIERVCGSQMAQLGYPLSARAAS